MLVQAGGGVAMASKLGETEGGAGTSGQSLSCPSPGHPLTAGGQGEEHAWLGAVLHGKVLMLSVIFFPP